jgi:hypothetical protein
LEGRVRTWNDWEGRVRIWKTGSGIRIWNGWEGRVQIWKGWEAGFGLKAMAKNAGLKQRINLSAEGKSKIYLALTWCIYVQKPDSQSKLDSLIFSKAWTLIS